MERIVSQGPMLSNKKLESDFMESRKIKQMKEKTMAVSIEKLLEKQKKFKEQAKSTLFPIV